MQLSDTFDLLIMGGGINGVGIARDAAGPWAQHILDHTLRISSPRRLRLVKGSHIFFGPAVFDYHGTLDLRFIKPVMAEDTITVRGRVTETRLETQGTRVSVHIWCENQHGDKTAIGTGSALIPA